MPTYVFKNIETNEIVEHEFKMSEYDKFVSEHPELSRYHDSFTFIDSVALGITKPPSDFQRHVIGRIQRANPLHTMESRWDIPKEY